VGVIGWLIVSRVSRNINEEGRRPARTMIAMARHRCVRYGYY
jgi:hypothetical protein